LHTHLRSISHRSSIQQLKCQDRKQGGIGSETRECVQVTASATPYPPLNFVTKGGHLKSPIGGFKCPPPLAQLVKWVSFVAKLIPQ